MGKSKGHIPTRTCITCGKKRNKRDLIRLVLDSGGMVVQDPDQKARGRGAYVCPDKSCWERLWKTGFLSKALRANGHIEPGCFPQSRREASPGDIE